ncbi:MAG TPA: family 1 encapsulin nanocompartment shell protein [Myxococcota bacterium]|nr:family 1 encapsulin nanocompartment shell protein [Myxococcota bacterium]
MNRELAPLSQRAWEAVESEARETLKLQLAARRLYDFEGPLGWEHSAIDLGDVEVLEGAAPSGAMVRRRVVRPLVELRVPFEIDRRETERVDRGAHTADLDAVREAARLFAAAEDTALFEGYADADLPGLLSDATTEGVALPRDPAAFPEAVESGLEQLRQAGVGGPYALALGPEPYTALHRGANEAGYPVLRHVQRLLDEPVVWAPALRGGVLVSLRGGDFKLVCGRDAAIGYLGHDEKRVRLYLEESFSAELRGPEAAVPMLPPLD